MVLKFQPLFSSDRCPAQSPRFRLRGFRSDESNQERPRQSQGHQGRVLTHHLCSYFYAREAPPGRRHIRKRVRPEGRKNGVVLLVFVSRGRETGTSFIAQDEPRREEESSEGEAKEGKVLGP